MFLCGMLGFYCGPQYLVNLCVTFAAYAYFSKSFSMIRQVQLKEKKDAEKKAEFTLNESIMNYETVKAFTNEKYEERRYNTILESVRKAAYAV